MPGYNHYSWCMCGWCYKTGSNGYSAQYVEADFDISFAKRELARHGADRSWSAFFVVPNATCPVCSAKVYYYQNAKGSRVFFDELGWPWPKHACTDNPRHRSDQGKHSLTPIVDRKRGTVAELFETAQKATFDPNASFRRKHGHSPFDLLKVLDVKRQGFENFIKAASLSPALENAIFLVFTSANFSPSIDDYLSFSGSEISLLDKETLAPRSFKAKVISEDAFTGADNQDRER